MDVETVTLFLALLAVATQVFTVSTVGLKIASWVSPSAARAFDSYREVVAPQALTLALGIATVATAGSLYFSEVAHFVPCDLCWYQRIAMYPLVPLLTIAAVRKDASIAPYVATLAVIGGAISAYHIVVERLPAAGAGFCDPANPCSVIWVNRLGYLTIPTMALSGFAAIAVLVYLAASRSGEDHEIEGAGAADQ
jgi:disulfide bond formation protein DsbB